MSRYVNSNEVDKFALPNRGHLSSKAIVCTAHLMLLQNSKAVLSTKDWVTYLCLVRDWCTKQEIDGVRYYFYPGFSPEDEDIVGGPDAGKLN